ncbi:MAG: hypothetical protein GY804_01080 [Alphaproteobacteria bacterium]|nr:hypothetical protein [Alphaproteobacteria bacterium]
MRHFEKEYEKEDMLRGLRAKEDQHRDDKGLVELINLKPKAWGLVPFEAITNPLSSVNFNFPFPQLLKLGGQLLLAEGNSVSEVNISTWTLTPLTINNHYLNTGVTQSGGQWHVLDFLDSWMMVNGTTILMKSQYQFDGSIGAPTIVSSNHLPVNTGCVHKGRTLLGGFTEGSFWGTDWQDFWSTWADAQATGLTYTISQGLGSNVVMWSNVGEGLSWLLYPDVGTGGIVTGSGFGVSRPKILELFKRGDLGFAVMPWKGYLYNMEELGEEVIVYGDNGIARMKSFIAPIPAYGVKPILQDIGINNRGAMAKGKNFHLFAANSGSLWMIGKDFEPIKLGYEEFISPMITNNIIINYDEYNDEFYICDGQITYLLTDKGLCRVNQLITSIIYHNTEPKAITKILGV